MTQSQILEILIEQGEELCDDVLKSIDGDTTPITHWNELEEWHNDTASILSSIEGLGHVDLHELDPNYKKSDLYRVLRDNLKKLKVAQKMLNNAAALKKTRSGTPQDHPSDTHVDNRDRSRINWPWFIVGCVLLTAALVAFFWGFYLGKLTYDQYFLLMWLLPLTSGFACGCFVGSLHVSGPVGSVIVTATSGFAVFLLTFYLLPKPHPFDAQATKLDATGTLRFLVKGWKGSPPDTLVFSLGAVFYDSEGKSVGRDTKIDPNNASASLTSLLVEAHRATTSLAAGTVPPESALVYEVTFSRSFVPTGEAYFNARLISQINSFRVALRAPMLDIHDPRLANVPRDPHIQPILEPLNDGFF